MPVSRLLFWHGLILGAAFPLAADGLYFIAGVGGASNWSWDLVIAGVAISVVLMGGSRHHRFGEGLLTGVAASVATVLVAAGVAAIL